MNHLSSIAQTLIFVAATLLTVTSCNSKKEDPNRPTIDIPVTAVTAIEAHSAINVKYVQTESSPKVTVTCKKIIATDLDVRVEGTRLIADFKKGASVPDRGVEVVVTAPAVTEFTVTSAATITLNDETNVTGNVSITTSTAGSFMAKKLNCQDLNIKSSSASQVQLTDLHCANLTAEASTTALVLIDGNAATAKLCQGSVSDIRCPKLVCEQTQRSSFDETPKKTVKTAAPKPATPDTTANKMKP